jgi:hypothetical protein
MDVFSRIDMDQLSMLRVLQYISTALITLSAYLLWKSNKNLLGRVVFVLTMVYLFASTSVYIYDIFANTFAISIYRGLIAYLTLHRGIAQDIIKYRTIGLYIIGVTLAKVGLYDVWYGIDSGIMRVVALMVLGGLLIYISTLYSKKYGGNMKGELELGNVWEG